MIQERCVKRSVTILTSFEFYTVLIEGVKQCAYFTSTPKDNPQSPVLKTQNMSMHARGLRDLIGAASGLDIVAWQQPFFGS